MSKALTRLRDLPDVQAARMREYSIDLKRIGALIPGWRTGNLGTLTGRSIDAGFQGSLGVDFVRNSADIPLAGYGGCGDCGRATSKVHAVQHLRREHR